MKFICTLILAIAAAGFLLGCGGSASPDQETQDSECIPADFIGPFGNPNHLPLCTADKKE
jgi:ABC-type glycerol-3-phosphate transport system substrate-binding protein